LVNGSRKIIDDLPLIGHFDPEALDGEEMIAAYAGTLPADRRPLLGRYQVLDTARKVVGVGRVGTRCYLSLLIADRRPRALADLPAAQGGDGVRAGAARRLVRLWNVTDPARPRPLGQPLATSSGNFVNSVAFSPDGHTLASGSDDLTVRRGTSPTRRAAGWDRGNLPLARWHR
jgi:hypothetical protein